MLMLSRRGISSANMAVCYDIDLPRPRLNRKWKIHFPSGGMWRINPPSSFNNYFLKENDILSKIVMIWPFLLSQNSVVSTFTSRCL